MMQFLAAALILGAALTEIRFTPGFDLKSLKGQPASLQLQEDYCTVTARKADRFCTFRLPVDTEWAPDLALSFEYRNRLPEGVKLVAFAVGVFTDQPKLRGYFRLDPSAEWKTARVPLGDCKFTAGTKITHVTIYNRIADKDPAAVTAFDIRNIKLERVPSAAAPAAGKSGIAQFYTPGADLEAKTSGDFLAVTRKTPSRELTAEFAFPKGLAVKPGQRAVLRYRVIHPKGGAVTGIMLKYRFAKTPMQCRTASVSPQWFGAPVPLAVKSPDKITRLTVVASITPREPKAIFGLEFSGIRIEDDPEYDPDADIPQSACALPLMDWKPGKPGTVYIATVIDMEHPEKTWQVKTTHHYCVPPEPLAPGKYRYHVFAGKTLVANGRWRILPDAHRWRFPEYDFGKIAAAKHPRLAQYIRVRYTDLAKVRNNAKNSLNFTMPKPPEVYEKGKDPAIKSWIVWYAQIANGVTSRTGSRMQDLAAAAVLFPENREYRDAAKKILLTVARDWDPEGASHPKHADLAASSLVRGMAMAYDVCYDDLTPEERKLAADAIRIRGRHFRERIVPIGSREGNHCWDNVRATATVAVVLAEEPGMEDWFGFTAYLFAYKFLPGRGFDGESEEGLYYWSYGFGNAAACLDLLKHTGGPDLYRQPWARVTARFPVYCAPPEGYKISFADNSKPNHRNLGPHRRDFVAKLAQEAGDPAGMWYAGLVPKDGPRPAVPLDIEQSMHFRHIGVVAFNTFLADGRENVALGFHSGKYFGNHQHADQNSFVINAYGEKLAIDGGYYDWWGSQHFLHYSVRTQAHNTVLVNGTGQALHVAGTDGRIAAYYDSPEFGYVEGDGSKAFLYGCLLKKFDRRIFFLKPDHVIVYDQLAAPEKSTFSFLMHSHTDDPIRTAGNTFEIDRPRAALTGTMFLPEKPKMRVVSSYPIRPDEGYSVQKVRICQPEWTLFAENAAPATDTEFLAAMRITRAGVPAAKPDWKMTETADYVALAGPVYHVVFNRHPGKPVTYLGRTIPGGGAAFRLDAAGKIAAEAIIGVTKPVSTALVGQDCTVPLDGKPVPAKRYVRTFPDGRAIYTVSGVLPIAKNGWLTIRRKAPGKMPLHVAVSSAKLRLAREIAPGAAETRLTVNAEPAVFTLDSAEDFTAEMSLADAQLPECSPRADVPPAGSIRFEAEDTSEPFLGGTQPVERKGASRDWILSGWNQPGFYAKWVFTVPAAGKYRVRVLAAHALPQTREFLIDGKPMGGDSGFCVWTPTGGFGYTPAEWRWFEMPWTVELAQGKHTLTIVQMKNSGNLDEIAVVPVK